MSAADPKALVVSPAARLLAPVADAPRLSNSNAELLQAVEVVDERGEARAIAVPRERPLTVWLNGRELVTLMTLGSAPEWLIVGYLCNQRVVTDISALDSIEVDWESGTAQVRARRLASASTRDTVGTACALGSAYSDLLRGAESIEIPGFATHISHSEILKVLETMRIHSDIHRAAGSVHSCAVFRASELLVAVEDVSRHNGVDTIIGWMRLHAVSGADKILFTTGRLTGEMVTKAALNGIPVLITRNGITAMGRELAVRFGITLLGRAANRRYLCYTGLDRVDLTS
jgi:FdhD protein